MSIESHGRQSETREGQDEEEEEEEPSYQQLDGDGWKKCKSKDGKKRWNGNEKAKCRSTQSYVDQCAAGCSRVWWANSVVWSPAGPASTNRPDSLLPFGS